MDYYTSNPLAIIRYTASCIVLFIHSNAYFLSGSWARSRAAAYFFLSDNPIDPNMPPIETPLLMALYTLHVKIWMLLWDQLQRQKLDPPIITHRRRAQL